MSMIKDTLDLIRENDGFPGRGFKMAASETGTEKTLMRFALEAYRNPSFSFAVDKGVVTDPKVIAQLKKLPPVASAIVCRIEAKLGRRLVRSRAERLIAAYQKVTSVEYVAQEQCSQLMKRLRSMQIELPASLELVTA